MHSGKVILALLFSSLFCMAQSTGLTGPGPGSTLNQQFVAQRRLPTHTKRGSGTKNASRQAASPESDVVVFIGDTVFAQFVDGASWSTSIYLVNLENHPTSFSVFFFNDNGTDLYVPVAGQGLVRGMLITLAAAGSTEFETTGTSPSLAQGWALLSQSTNDSVGGMAVFRQSVPGRQPQEAVVPIVNQFSDHFVLMFDNTAYVTGIAVANPTLVAVVIPVNIRDGFGNIIDTRTISLGPYSHTAFVLSSVWPSTAGKRGAIEFLTSGFGVGALGLRFNGAAFTSFNVLENFNWVVP